MKNQTKASLYIFFSGMLLNILIQLIYGLEFKSRQLSIFLLIESSIAVLIITTINLILILLIWGIVRLFRKKFTAFIIPSLIITILTFLIIFLAAIYDYRKDNSSYSKNMNESYSISFTETIEEVIPSKITYQLPYVSKKKIKDGKIIEEKVEPQEFFGVPYIYKILKLNTKRPILEKYIGDKVVEQKQLIVLNRTSQGNIYLAEVSQVGNVFLISVFQKQHTVALSMQYWLSYEDAIILWQGFGLYK